MSFLRTHLTLARWTCQASYAKVREFHGVSLNHVDFRHGAGNRRR